MCGSVVVVSHFLWQFVWIDYSGNRQLDSSLFLLLLSERCLSLLEKQISIIFAGELLQQQLRQSDDE